MTTESHKFVLSATVDSPHSHEFVTVSAQV